MADLSPRTGKSPDPSCDKDNFRVQGLTIFTITQATMYNTLCYTNNPSANNICYKHSSFTSILFM